jgi:hypothetical protein
MHENRGYTAAALARHSLLSCPSWSESCSHRSRIRKVADALLRVPTPVMGDGEHCHPGVPAFAGGMPAGVAASCQASLVRLKPGLPISNIRINISTFIRQECEQQTA